MSTSNLANSYDHLGRYADALKLRVETLALQKAKLGSDHPDTLRTMGNLAGTYFRLQRRAEALKLYEDTLALYDAKLGSDHPDTLRSMGNLALAYEALGRLADALKLSREALVLFEAKLGPDHPQTLVMMCRVATYLRHLDRDAEAAPIIDECLKRAKGKIVVPKMIVRLKTLQIIPQLRHFERTKDAAGCRTTAETFEKLPLTDAHDLYHAACFRAITATVIKHDPKTPGTDASRLAGAEADRAMAWLARAIAAGFNDVVLMKRDNAMDALREREDYKKLVAMLEAITK